jgi:hypothetical protein
VQLKLADAGVAGIAGIVQLGEHATDAARELYRKTYVTDADGTHSHVHGANLSMRADAYLDAGGWSRRPLAEDHCLWQRLKRRGGVFVIADSNRCVWRSSPCERIGCGRS